MASTTSATATLSHWVCSTPYGDRPAEVRQETVTLLYDQVGCMLASATLPSCQPVMALVRRLSPPAVQHCGAPGADLGHAGGPGQRDHRAWR
jgi:hypothetical protein